MNSGPAFDRRTLNVREGGSFMKTNMGCLSVVFLALLAAGCSSSDSAKGAQGSGVGMRISDLPAGAICPFGGTKIEVGPDANNDGLPDTVTSTKYVCNAGDPVTASKTATASIDNVNVVPGSGSASMAIDFTVKNGAGNEIVGLGDADVQDSTRTGHLAFEIAKLLPGTNGDTNTWWTIASEATLTGLTNKGGGHYTYTTGALATGGSATSASYDATRLTRVVVRVVPNNSQMLADAAKGWVTWDYAMGHLDTLGSGANASYDITNGSTATKDVVRTTACLECHNRFGGKTSFHAGEGNVSTEACAVCHLASSGTPTGDAELGRFVHKIHTAQAADGIDYTTMIYPQDVRNCTKCHQGGADSDNWKTKPTMAICGSCHFAVDFATGASHTGGAQADNSACAVTCHTPAKIAGYHVPVVPPDPNNSYSNPGTGSAETNAAYLAAAGVLPAGADRITYVVKSVDTVADATITPSKRPSITFKLQKNGADVSFGIYSAATVTNIMSGFVGSPSVYFAWAVPQDSIAAPADFNATANAYIKKVWDGTATGSGAGTLAGPDGSGYYTLTLTGVRVPTTAVMLTGGVGYTYNLASTQPLTQVNLPAYPYDWFTRVGGLVVPAPNVWKVGTGFTGRRVVVDTARCSTCHAGLGVNPTFHAGQRNDAPSCSFCHTPNNTISGWPVSAAARVHAIHGASKRTVPYTWRAAATGGFNTYPGVLNNCEQCHVPGGYDYSGSMYTGNQTVANMLKTTSATGIYNPDPLVNSQYFTISPYVIVDGVTNYGAGFSFNAVTGVTTDAQPTTLVQSPVTAVCVSCHDSTVARAHMTSTGGSFYAARSAAANDTEQCFLCHAAGTVAAIKEMHSK